MNSNNYKFLSNKVESDDEQEMLMIINKRIDEIILKSSFSAEHTLEALICEFEANNNLASVYAVCSITYGCIMVLVTLVTNALFDSLAILANVMIVSLFVVSALLLFVSEYEKKCSEKRAYILTALRFRYNKIKEKQNITDENLLENQIDSCVDEKTYTVNIH